jgi:hypothetical protein
MMERDGILNIAGTAKHCAHEPSSVGTLVPTPLSHDVDRASMPPADHVVMIMDDDYCIRDALQELLAAPQLARRRVRRRRRRGKQLPTLGRSHHRCDLIGGVKVPEEASLHRSGPTGNGGTPGGGGVTALPEIAGFISAARHGWDSNGRHMGTTALDAGSRERALPSEQRVLDLARDLNLGREKLTATSTTALASPAAEPIDPKARVLRCAELWRTPSVEAAQFEVVTRKGTFRPGSGLPGRVWETGAPAYIPDVGHDVAFRRMDIAARVRGPGPIRGESHHG